MELSDWRNNDPGAPLAAHSELIVAALRGAGALTMNQMLTALAGATITPDMLKSRLARLRDAGWIEHAGHVTSQGSPRLWRLTARGRDAVARGRPLPRRLIRAPLWLERGPGAGAFAAKAAPTPPRVPDPARMALPRRDSPIAFKPWREPMFSEPARAGSMDFKRIPSKGPF